MTREQKVAVDIYTYIYRTFFGNSKEEVEYRMRYGSNGAATKVLEYINKTYIINEEEVIINE